MKFLRSYLLFALLGILFFGCKKYPENNLWFKKPDKVFKGGKITAYAVNGVDKMPYFRDLYKSFPYNWYGQSVDDIFELPFTYAAGSEDFNSDYGKGTLKFSETKREIEISFKPLNWDQGAENIFVGNISWKIMKLTKTGQLKIQGKYDFKLYEIEFN
ncbi:MAG TPA: hypothetical protein VN026_08460 [Bacteroidia bacterium]|jgi:hypothetical protein|nr:hypothetical protein [Bacteroidia bacterium]